MSESLYFIAVLPPEDIQETITALKHEIAEKYDSKHALRSPPHITLHMPFKWKEKRCDELAEMIRNLNDDLEPLEIELKNFDFFEPRVIFVDVVKNQKLEKLQKKVVDACRKQLKLDNANYKNRPFHPHMTIGFRDLKKRMFYQAKQDFEKRTLKYHFSAKEIRLLKHDGRQWLLVEV